MQLVITVLGEDRGDLIMELTRTIRDCKCSVLESRMTELGAEFAAHLLIEGNWNHIVKLEHALEALSTRLDLKINTMRSKDISELEELGLPYAVDVFATDKSSNIHELATFLTARNIKIVDMTTSRYSAAYSGAAVFLAHIIVTVPASQRIISLRDEFLDFCDQFNIDAILEPVKR
ncbi:MAG: glycine cleavage system protein R [Methylococcaceae bacterium]